MTCGVCLCDGGRGEESGLEMQTLDLRDPGGGSRRGLRLLLHLITGFPAPLIPYCTDVSLFIAVLGEHAEGKDLRSGYRVRRGFGLVIFPVVVLFLLFFPTRTRPMYLAHITLIPATALSLCAFLLASEYLLFLVVSYMHTMQLYHVHSLLFSPKTPTNMSPPPFYVLLSCCFVLTH